MRNGMRPEFTNVLKGFRQCAPCIRSIASGFFIMPLSVQPAPDPSSHAFTPRENT